MKMNITLASVMAGLIVLAGIAVLFVVQYNGIVKSRVAIDEAKGQVESVLQRRLDLIPNLVETVKAYATHERETLEAVTKARSQAMATLGKVSRSKVLGKEEMAAIAQSQSQLSGALSKIYVAFENYPEIKANANFLTLQDQMEGTENRISVERQRYNSTVRYYNSQIATFPGNILAGMFSWQPREYFESAQEAKQGVKVKF